MLSQNNMQEKQLLIQEKILNYYEDRDWKTLWVYVFLHGWMQNWKSFEKMTDILSEKWLPWISFDFPGFWKSQLQSLDMTIEDYATVISDALEKLWLQRITLIGHSFGGRVWIYLAGTHHPEIKELVLIGSAGIAHPMSFSRTLIVKTGKAFFSLPWLHKIWKKIKEKNSSRDALSAGKLEKIFRNTIERDLQEEMKHIQIPTLLIYGEDDSETPPSEGEIIAWHIEDSEFHILKGDHFIFQEIPKTITKLILDFQD